MLYIVTETLKLGVKSTKSLKLMKYFNKLHSLSYLISINLKSRHLPKLSLFLFFKHPINVI